MATISEHSRAVAPVSTEFQAILRIAPRPHADADLEQVSDMVLEAVSVQGAGVALGPVVSINLDDRVVELEVTIEAVSASEVHQKIGLILTMIERGTPLCLLESTAAPALDGPLDRQLLCT